MALKRFTADLRSARKRLEDTGIPGIVDLERGGAQGEVLVTFIHENLADPILIHLLSARPDAYPDGNNFLLSTYNARDSHPAVTSALENLQNFTFGQTVFESLRDVSFGLGRALSQCDINADSYAITDGSADDSSILEDNDDDDEQDRYEGDDPIFGLDSLSGQKSEDTPHTGGKMAPGVLNKIRRDLRKAREAGAKIGVLSGVEKNARTHVVSLSIRARKLGISDEALEAWDVEPSDYIVLLFRVNEPYPSMEKLVKRATSSIKADFRFGKCNKSKPSPESAFRAFDTLSDSTAEERDSQIQPADPNADSHPFSKLFISNSIEQFMNEHFVALVKLRLTGYQSWEDANSHILNLIMQQSPDGPTKVSGDVDSNGKGRHNGKGKGKGKDKDVVSDPAQSLFANASGQQALPTILTWDSFAESTTDISLPLVAMQFSLHYFVRCTEYCLRCHRKVKKGFEALKPYVCEDPLCLFQYMTMGFGPSIEHEIMSQPYVVDLLITLCDSSIQHHLSMRVPGEASTQETFPIRDFPTGLRLKVPSLPPLLSPAPCSQPVRTQPISNVLTQDQPNLYGSPVKVSVHFDSQTMRVIDPEGIDKLTEKSWVVLRHQLGDVNGSRVFGYKPAGKVLVHQAYLKHVDRPNNRIEFEMKHLDTLLLSFIQPGDPMQTLELYNYDFELDDLDNGGKARAMTAILATIPPVSRLREYLIKHPHTRLRSYHGISSSAVTLLEWIVSSNRSFILQVNHVDDVHSQDSDSLRTIKTRDQEVIPSLGQDFVQFRFAMGNPDKEIRFQRALKELEAQSASPYPTLFAWHGSSLQNWHSILRQGLDFKKIANGRSYGNGVYFSPNYATSLQYMQQNYISWPNSALNPNGVIALCEIINAPAKFVSSSPHYVVQQLDWIQCRYLFIKPAASKSSQSSASATSLDTFDELPQDPSRTVLGPQGTALKIPRKALPSSRAGQGKIQRPERTSSKRPLKSNMNDGDTDEEDAADLDALFSDEESPEPPRKRLQALTRRRKAYLMISMTDFRPGTLNLESIPRLALPEWANAISSKRLASEIKTMQKIQKTTPLHELGWYIDFSNIENMFQWIVELHTFDPELPLANDMKEAGITSVVLEVRFGRDYPLSPPFVRVIRPRFLPFMHGGGGHVTIGGAICMEMLTSTGWTVVMSMESVLISIKMAISSLHPQPARLQHSARNMGDYSAHEALDAFQRFANKHNWKVPSDIAANATRT